MTSWQITIILTYGALGLFSSYLAYRKCKFEKKNLGFIGVTPFILYGAFVWADLVVFGVFWALFSLICILLNDWLLFLLGQSVFWLIRSFGETIYWFNQQFSTIERYSLKDHFFAKIFNYDDYTLWFIMQIFMQCITVISAILSLYFGKVWLVSRF